jgi:hypothetical protein
LYTSGWCDYKIIISIFNGGNYGCDYNGSWI